MLGFVCPKPTPKSDAQECTLTGQFLAILGGWGRMVPRLLSRNSEELRRKRLEKDKLFNPRGLVTCGRSRLLPAPPATSAFAFPYWPVNGTKKHNSAQSCTTRDASRMDREFLSHRWAEGADVTSPGRVTRVELHNRVHTPQTPGLRRRSALLRVSALDLLSSGSGENRVQRRACRDKEGPPILSAKHHL